MLLGGGRPFRVRTVPVVKSAPGMEEHPDLAALRARLDEEERAYAALLATLDPPAAPPLPAQPHPRRP